MGYLGRMIKSILRRQRKISLAAVQRQVTLDHPTWRINDVVIRAVEEDRVVVLVYYGEDGCAYRPEPIACYAIPTSTAYELPYDGTSAYFVRNRK